MEIAQQEMRLLLEEARRYLHGRTLSLLLKDLPEHHAPRWHVHGLLGHMHNVIVAAKRLSDRTKIDVVSAAAFHDIGKIHQFPKALRAFEAGQDSGDAYVAHEQLSATIAQRNKLGKLRCAIIGAHQHAYNQAKPATILKKVGCTPGQDLIGLKCWMVLCAADAVGKGFTPDQILQRPLVAEKFRELADIACMRSGDRTLSLCCEAVESWEPISRDQLPKFR